MILILLRNVMNKFNTIDDNILIIKRICQIIREDYGAANDNINVALESIKAYCSKINIDINAIAEHIAIIDIKVSNRNKAKNSYTNSNMNTTSRNRKSFNRKPKTAKTNNVPVKQ